MNTTCKLFKLKMPLNTLHFTNYPIFIKYNKNSLIKNVYTLYGFSSL